MTDWIEVPGRRTLRSKTYHDAAQPGRFQCVATSAVLHYPTSTGMQEVDMRPEPTATGWRIRQNGWHFSLDRDGWVGFGGRGGQRWIRFRLTQVGYLHWATRGWTTIANAPDYDVSHLSLEQPGNTIGPNQEMVYTHAKATWSSLWTTPGGGRVDVRWMASGRGLKEEIVLNQAARAWLIAHQPPATPAAQTWFTWLFEVDLSDIPNLHLGDTPIDLADTALIERAGLSDEVGRLLAFLPMSHAYQPGQIATTPLQSRLWSDEASGKVWLGIGIKSSILAAVPAGDVVFDPSISVPTAAGADDGWEDGTGALSVDGTYMDVKSYTPDTNANYRCAAARVETTIPQGATLVSATWDVRTASVAGHYDANMDIYFNDVDAAANLTDEADVIGRARTTASVAWVQDGLAASTVVSSPDVSTPLQEVVDRASYAAGNGIMGLFIAKVSASTKSLYITTWESAYTEPTLVATYTTAETVTISPDRAETAGGTIDPTVAISGASVTVTPAVARGVGRAINPAVVMLGSPPPIDSQYPESDSDQSLRVYVDVLDGSGNRIGAGPVTAISAASVSRKLDGVGSFSLSTPATDERALALLEENRQVVIFGYLGGIIRELGRGTIHERDIKGGPGETLLSVSGPDALEQLKYRNTLLNRAFDNQSTALVVGSLASLASWTSYVDTGLGLVTMTFNGESVLKAIQMIAENQGLHLRHESGTTLRFGLMGDDIGLRLIQRSTVPQELYSNRLVALIEDITLSSSRKMLANWLLPLGGEDEAAPITLQSSTRTEPYTIQTMTGPDGRTLYYLADAASVADYGQIERVLTFKAITQTDSTPLAAQQAANMLYDAAATWLGRAAVRQDVYSVKLRKVWEVTIRPGDKVRLVYRGEVTQRGVVVRYLDCDELFWVLDVQESIGVEGHVVYLKLSNVDEIEQDAVKTLVDAVELSGARQSKG